MEPAGSGASIKQLWANETVWFWKHTVAEQKKAAPFVEFVVLTLIW
jgi:hypothetical protein